jgi:serine/threonine protein kinase HipA of HipAB toxin-antitoxin module
MGNSSLLFYAIKTFQRYTPAYDLFWSRPHPEDGTGLLKTRQVPVRKSFGWLSVMGLPYERFVAC